jgi:hypothetical protein
MRRPTCCASPHSSSWRLRTTACRCRYVCVCVLKGLVAGYCAMRACATARDTPCTCARSRHQVAAAPSPAAVAITNSFGMPSMDAQFLLQDIPAAAAALGPGQVRCCVSRCVGAGARGHTHRLVPCCASHRCCHAPHHAPCCHPSSWWCPSRARRSATGAPPASRETLPTPRCWHSAQVRVCVPAGSVRGLCARVVCSTAYLHTPACACCSTCCPDARGLWPHQVRA